MNWILKEKGDIDDQEKKNTCQKRKHYIAEFQDNSMLNDEIKKICKKIKIKRLESTRVSMTNS